MCEHKLSITNPNPEAIRKVKQCTNKINKVIATQLYQHNWLQKNLITNPLGLTIYKYVI